MTVTESIPLLIVVLLLVSMGGGEVERMDVAFAGEHDVESIEDVQVVAGGTTTVPGNASVAGDVYVIGGTLGVEGSADGDVTAFAGNLTVADGATITGTLQRYGGEVDVADGASVGQFSEFEAPVPNDSPTQRVGSFLVQFAVLGLAGAVLVRRRPALLENVGDAIAGHPIVSGVVGALAAVTLLVLFVYMAFTLLLIPVAIAGLIVEALIVLYGQIALGHLLGRRVPIDRADLATAAGIGALLGLLEVLGFVPVLGGLVQLALLVVGFGAVVNTYFGLASFEPVTIPGGTE